MTNNTKTEANLANQIVHIGLEFPDNIPDIVIDKVTEDLKTSGLLLKVRKNESVRMYAALEWVIPTMFGAYILKPYFESFLQEAGKDHYKVLKEWLKKFTDSGRATKVHHITASQSTKKNIGKDNQSKSVSLLLQTKNGKFIKLLFDNDLAKEDWDNAIDQLLNFAIENYEKYPNDKLTSEIQLFDNDSNHRIYAIIERKSKKIIFYSEKDLFHLQNKLNEEC